MVQRINKALKHSNHFLKPMASIALIFSFILPFALVKYCSKTPKEVSATVVNSPLLFSNETTTAASQDSYDDALNQYLFNSLMLSDSTPASIIPFSTQNPAYALLTSTSIKDRHLEYSTSIVSPSPSARQSSLNTTTSKENWKTFITRENDSLAKIFKRVGLSHAVLRKLMTDIPQIKTLSLKPNQQIQFLLNNNELEKMKLPLTNIQSLVIYREKQSYKSQIHAQKTDTVKRFLTATVNGSLYLTARRNNIPFTLIRQMTQLFSSEMNFKRDVKTGDQFTLIYQATYLKNKLITTGDILAVTYKTKNKTFQAFRYTNRAGHTEYYNAQGASLKKAFDRYPVQFTHISSTFSYNRYHPILHYRKPHRGIDLAAPMGTPIHATGNGYIASIGRQRGYGNLIKINHSKTHSTLYGHLLRFQKGISKGSFVKRGQIIGYVGQSGYATGPHCHYEFRINNQPKNPTTVSLPIGYPIPNKELALFKDLSGTMLAELQSFEKTQLAKL